jgi:hypothetical protein
MSEFDLLYLMQLVLCLPLTLHCDWIHCPLLDMTVYPELEEDRSPSSALRFVYSFMDGSPYRQCVMIVK